MPVLDFSRLGSRAVKASSDNRDREPCPEDAMPVASKGCGTDPGLALSAASAFRNRRNAYLDYLRRLSPQSRRLRFGSASIDGQALEWFATMPSRKLFLVEGEHLRGALELFDAPGLEAELAISVEDAFQGRGHGRRLFTEGLEWANALGLKTLLVMCDAGNWRMRRLLAGVGVAQRLEYQWVTAFIPLDRR